MFSETIPLHLLLAQVDCGAVIVCSDINLRVGPTFVVYLLPKTRSSSSFLTVCKRLDMKEPPFSCEYFVVEEDMVRVQRNCDQKDGRGRPWLGAENKFERPP